MDRRPDREGYLGFREAVHNGNDAVLRRAHEAWMNEKDKPVSEMAQYYDMFSTHAEIGGHWRDSKHTSITDNQNKLEAIRNETARQQAAKRVERIAKAWESCKAQSEAHYIEVKDFTVKDRIRTRQEENLQETEGQSWFRVTHEYDRKYLDNLNNLDSRMNRAIDKAYTYAEKHDMKQDRRREIDLVRRMSHSNDNRRGSRM